MEREKELLEKVIKLQELAEDMIEEFADAGYELTADMFRDNLERITKN